jgi:hypothetical protein
MLVIGIAAYNAWWDFAVRSDACDCGWIPTIELEYAAAIFAAFQLIAGVLAWIVVQRVFPARGSRLNRPLD